MSPATDVATGSVSGSVTGSASPPAAESGLPRPDLGRLHEVTAALAARAPEYDRTGAFPHESLQLVHDAGLLTAGVDPRYGGPGGSFTDITRILLALGRGDPSVALIAGMTIVPHLLHPRSPWPEELYRRVLAESALRPTLLNHARAEPEMGSSTRGPLPATTARRTADGWSLTGHKRYVTGSEGLSYFLVWAATDEPEPRVGNFIVPAGTPGIEILPTWHQLGMRATGSNEVVFTDVEIPADHVHELAPPGAAPAPGVLPGSVTLLLSSALYLGVARAAQSAVHTYAHERVPAALGHSLAGTGRYKRGAGEIETLLSSAEQLIFGVAGQVDRGEPVRGVDALASKVIVVRHVTSAVETGLRLLGNPGLARENPLERHFRDIQSAGVHAPGEDAVLPLVGATALAAEAPDA
ncbi:acyl-CoA dehydrogenase family protein [Streptomyces sp. NPDC059477]|uniref:acyl-CoA dehydrogenase family protein n=1 Tax=Streptomyces sp. NPDC059477 TaxID=3346847 RepID=UPI003673F9CB